MAHVFTVYCRKKDLNVHGDYRYKEFYVVGTSFSEVESRVLPRLHGFEVMSIDKSLEGEVVS